MQLSQIPAKILAAFAVSGSKRTIPVPSQIGVTAGAASYTDGFPPLTFTPLNAGGVPPAGQDFNGIFNAITLIQQWQSAGGVFPYDAAWSTANSGYPKGACLLRADGTGFWFNTVDNNTADPDGATPTGWVPEWQYGITAIAGLTNANVTLTSSQYGRQIITLAGTLTGNVQIIFPAIVGEQWLIVNNTTGAFSVTAKTATGTGVVVPTGTQASVWGDGTNLNSSSPPGRLIGTPRVIAATGTYTPTAGTKAVLVRLQGAGAGGGVAVTTGAGQCSAGSGGGGGGYCESYLTSGFSGVTVTIGTGGASNGAGGASSFGALMTAGGAPAPSVNTAASNTVVQPVGQGVGGTATGGNLLNSQGSGGSWALYGSTVSSGTGGGGGFGLGGGFVSGTTAGLSASNYGAGGSGASQLAGGAGNVSGGSGGTGVCIIYEFGG